MKFHNEIGNEKLFRLVDMCNLVVLMPNNGCC